MTETYYIAVSGSETQQRVTVPRPVAQKLKSHPGDYVQVELTLMVSDDKGVVI